MRYSWILKPCARLVASVLAVTGFLPIHAPTAASAADVSKFDPGLIISDRAFYDSSSMTVEEIQKFLDSQVSSCVDDGGPKCLRDYREDVVGSAAISDTLHWWDENPRVCRDIPPAMNQSSAQIIFTVAQACGINPKVILVTLQKEQGLVQGKNPTEYMYKAAMGYGCPDSHPEICGKDSLVASRLFWQVLRGTSQFKWYGDPRGSFTSLKVGTTITREYHEQPYLVVDSNWDPSRTVTDVYKRTYQGGSYKLVKRLDNRGNPVKNSAGLETFWVRQLDDTKIRRCATASFQLRSAATAALYYYTPFVPNAAALGNLYGEGDSCSAYGNRNFWRFYTDWFGDPVAGSFMVTAENSPTYLIVNNQKIEIPDSLTSAAYKPLGPVGKVSKGYLDQFPTTAGKLPRVVKSSASPPNYFVIDHGQRVDYSCEQISRIGLNCDDAIELDANQLGLLPVVQPDIVRDIKGNQFAIIGSVRYALSDPVTRAAFAPMFVSSSGATKKVIEPPTVSTTHLAKFSDGGLYKPLVRSPASPCYLVHGGKRYSFTNDAQMAEFGVDCVKDAVYVASTVAQNLPIAGVITEYMTATTGEKYLIQDGTKRQIFDTKSSQTIGLPALSPVSAAAFAWMPIGKPVIRDKILFASNTAGEKILHLDGVAYTVADNTASELSLASVFEASSLKLPDDALAPILAEDPLKPIVSDPSGQQYILTSKGARRVEPGKTLTDAATKVSANFIAAFTPSSATPIPTTVFVKSSASATVYLVESGVKRELLTTADRTKFATLMTKTTIEPLSSSALAQIPTGSPVITPGSFVKDTSTNKTYLIDTLSRAVLVPNANQAALLGLPAPKSYSATALKGYTKGAALKNTKLKCGTQTYLSISGSLYPVSDALAEEYPGGALSISDITCGNLVKSTKAAGVFIKSTADNKIYFIEDGKKRLISGPNYLSKKQSLAPYVLVGPYFASLIPNGTTVADSEVLSVSSVEAPAPTVTPTPTASPTPTATPTPTPSPSGNLAVGSFVQHEVTKVLYLIDANLRAVKIANDSQAVLLGLENPRVVSSSELEGYKFGAVIQSPKLRCGTQVYLTVTGTLYPISLANAAEYSGGALTISAEACTNLTKSATQAGLFIRTADQQIFVVENGTKRAITGSEYWSLKRATGSPGFVYVGPYFASMMPTI